MATKKNNVSKSEVKQPKPRKKPVRRELPPGAEFVETTAEFEGITVPVKYYTLAWEGEIIKFANKTALFRTYDRFMNPPSRTPVTRLMTKCNNFREALKMFGQYPELDSPLEKIKIALATALDELNKDETPSNQW